MVYPVSVLLSQLHLQNVISNHTLKNALHTPSFFLCRQDPSLHIPLSIPSETLNAESSSAGPGIHSFGAMVLATLSFTRKSTCAQCGCSKPSHICSLGAQFCHSHWGTAMASLLTIAPGLHLHTPAVTSSTALTREKLPTGC